MGSSNMKDIRRSIRSVESTMQITKAMELVASSKLRKAKEKVEKIRPFFSLLYSAMNDIVLNNNDLSTEYTKAMELVASSKLRKAKEKVEKIRPFFSLLYSAMNDIVLNNNDLSTEYTKKRKINKSMYIIIAGDRGLAGGFNSNLFKFTENHINGKNCDIIAIGKKTIEYFSRKNYNIVAEFSDISEDISTNDASDISKIITDKYKNFDVDEVFIIYTFSKTPLSQEPKILDVLPLNMDLKENKKKARELVIYEPSAEIVFEKIVPQYITGLQEPKILDVLPLNMDLKENKKKARELVIYEPSAEIVFEKIVPQYITGLLLGAIIESYAAEQGARRIAMETANDNGKEMLATLSLYYNRARQASITQEISEIVAGSNTQNI